SRYFGKIYEKWSKWSEDKRSSNVTLGMPFCYIFILLFCCTLRTFPHLVISHVFPSLPHLNSNLKVMFMHVKMKIYPSLLQLPLFLFSIPNTYLPLQFSTFPFTSPSPNMSKVTYRVCINI